MALDAAALSAFTAHLETKRGKEPEKKSIIRVSSAGDCSRKIGYKLLGFPAEAPTTNELITFEIGHSYHNMLQKWLVEMRWLSGSAMTEVFLADVPGRVQGSCDGITVRLDKKGQPDQKGTRRVIEIKSITNVATERFGKESAGAFTRLEKPRDYHLDQANTYAHLWNQSLPKWAEDDGDGESMLWPDPVDLVHDRVEHITMIYVAKDTADTPLKVFTVPISEKRIGRLTEKFAKVWDRVDKEELPDRDYNPLSGFPPCSYCPFHALCLADGS